MANLTLKVGDDVLRRARISALERGTSLNALVRRYLEELAGPSDADPVQAFVAEAERSPGGSGPGGRSWTRADLHDRHQSA
ncbi:hypothetical protein [Euzebya sp.]|uniref:hypothetical protein n=1 Tax=Euzebya sp. TaxID=1971409 RepID=UPI003516A261